MTEEQNTYQDLQFQDPRQERIHRRLMELAPGPAAFYRDACRLRDDPRGLETVVHLVSHLLREVEGAVMAMLKAIAAMGNGGLTALSDDGESRTTLDIIIEALEIDRDHPVVQAWRRFTGKGKGVALQGMAHRNNLESPRRISSDVVETWEAVDTALDFILERFEDKFAVSFYGIVDELLQVEHPSKHDVQRLLEEVPRNPYVQLHFYSRAGPEWLDPLRAKRVFDDPPSRIIDEQTSYVTYLLWPQSRYLVRMAKDHPSTAKCVSDVIDGLPLTDNYRVLVDCADAGLYLPSDLAARIAPRVEGWLAFTDADLLPHRLGELMSRLARDGQAQGALQMARSLLSLTPAVERKGRRDVAARFRPWQYERIIHDELPSMVQVAPIGTLSLLTDLLEDAAASMTMLVDGMERPRPSWHWRQEIEATDTLGGAAEALDLLVDAVLDTAFLAVSSGQLDVERVVADLENRGVGILDRVALAVLELHGHAAPDLVRSHLASRTLYDSVDLRHEYRRLLHRRFGELTPEDRDLILGWIREGPGRDSAERFYQNLRGRGPSEEESREYVQRRQLERLALVREDLSGEWREWYDDLVADLGEPDVQLARKPIEVRPGYESPLSPAEIQDLPVDDLVKYLAEYRSEGSVFGPNEEGLADSLRRIVAAEPERYADSAEKFRDVNPRYITALLSAFWEAGREKRAVNWDQILQLAASVVRRREPGDESPLSPTGWMRRVIANLIDFGLHQGPAQIPRVLLPATWQVLAPLTADPDPVPENEANILAHGGDPHSLALNATRAIALHAVMLYAWMVSRVEVSDSGHGDAGLQTVPEARAVVEAHLDLDLEPSLAVRSVYGSQFPLLVALDSEWSLDHVDSMFATGPAKEAAWSAAWNAYVSTNPPYQNVFPMLRDQYMRAVATLCQHPVDAEATAAQEGLSHHLLGAYAAGLVDITDDLIVQFFDGAAAPLRHQSLAAIGRGLLNSDHQIDERRRERYMRLWEWRATSQEQETPPDSRAELRTFGWWFSSGQFDTAWTLQQLESVLEQVHSIDLEERAVERFAELPPTTTAPAIRCLLLMVQGMARDTWVSSDWKDAATIVIQRALVDGDADVRDSALRAVNLLVDRGHPQFRDLPHSSEHE